MTTTNPTNNQGLTGIVTYVFGPLSLLLLTVATFFLGASQSRTHISTAAVHNIGVHIHSDIPLGGLSGAFGPTALPRFSSLDQQTTLRFADPALQRAVAIAKSNHVWYASLYNGNQMDGVVERVIRQSSWSSPPEIFQVPAIDSGATALASGPSGVWFTASKGDLIGHVLRDGTVVEYPVRFRGARPDSPVVAADGALWFTEAGVGKIARFDPSSESLEDYPRGSALPSVGQLAVRGDDVWFSEPQSAKIGRLHWPSGLVTEFSLADKKSSPAALAVDSSGLVWFIDETREALGRFDPQLQAVREFRQARLPKCLAATAADAVWLCMDTGLARFDASSGKTTFYALPKNFSPWEIVAASDEGIRFSSAGGIGYTQTGNTVRRYIPDYQATSYRDTAYTPDVEAFQRTHPSFQGDIGEDTSDGTRIIRTWTDVTGDLGFDHLVATPDGALWLTKQGSLARFSASSMTVLKFLNLSPESFAYSVVADHRGRVWLIEQNRLIRFAESGVVDRIIYQSPRGIPNDVVVARDDSLWLALRGALVHLGASGASQRYPVAGGGPFGVALDAHGHVWFAARTTLGELEPLTGAIATYALPMQPCAPVALVAQPDNTIWFTDAAGRIGRVRPDRRIEEFPIPHPQSVPFGLAAAPNGTLWFTEFLGASLGELDSRSLAIHEHKVPWANSFPVGLVVDRNGTVWFADANGSLGAFDSARGFRQAAVPTPQPRGG